MVILNGGEWGILSEEQKEIYDLFFNQNLAVKQIAFRRGTSREAVYKILRKIKQKYGSDYTKHRGLQKQGYGSKCKPPKQKENWRFHGLHFIINPYYFYPRFQKIRKERGNYGIVHKQFTIMLYEDSIRIQSKKGIGWLDLDKFKAIQKAENDFNDFLSYAAKTYGFEFQKEGRISIKLISSELALENSKFSEKYLETTKENTLIVRDIKGKVCFLIDQSKSVPEHEYIGQNTITNSEKIEVYIQDFLYNNPLTNSQIASRLNDTITAIDKLKDVVEKIIK